MIAFVGPFVIPCGEAQVFLMRLGFVKWRFQCESNHQRFYTSVVCFLSRVFLRWLVCFQAIRISSYIFQNQFQTNLDFSEVNVFLTIIFIWFISSFICISCLNVCEQECSKVGKMKVEAGQAALITGAGGGIGCLPPPVHMQMFSFHELNEFNVSLICELFFRQELAES